MSDTTKNQDEIEVARWAEAIESMDEELAQGFDITKTVKILSKDDIDGLLGFTAPPEEAPAAEPSEALTPVPVPTPIPSPVIIPLPILVPVFIPIPIVCQPPARAETVGVGEIAWECDRAG